MKLHQPDIQAFWHDPFPFIYFTVIPLSSRSEVDKIYQKPGYYIRFDLTMMEQS